MFVSIGLACGASGAEVMMNVTPEELENGIRMGIVAALEWARRTKLLPAAESEDIEQIARIAVWKAAVGFDPARGCAFNTLAGKSAERAVARYAVRLSGLSRTRWEELGRTPAHRLPEELETVRFSELGPDGEEWEPVALDALFDPKREREEEVLEAVERLPEVDRKVLLRHF